MKFVLFSLLTFASIANASLPTINLPLPDYNIHIAVKTDGFPQNQTGYLILQCTGQMRIWVNWQANQAKPGATVELPVGCERFEVNAISYAPTGGMDDVTYEIYYGQRKLFTSKKPAASMQPDVYKVIHEIDQ